MKHNRDLRRNLIFLAAKAETSIQKELTGFNYLVGGNHKENNPWQGPWCPS